MMSSNSLFAVTSTDLQLDKLPFNQGKTCSWFRRWLFHSFVSCSGLFDQIWIWITSREGTVAIFEREVFHRALLTIMMPSVAYFLTFLRWADSPHFSCFWSWLELQTFECLLAWNISAHLTKNKALYHYVRELIMFADSIFSTVADNVFIFALY